MGDGRWFYRCEQEWIAIVERLKQTPCPHCKTIGRRLRNDLPMSVTISSLGREAPPSKMRDGRFVFLCPSCGDMLVAVNPRNNLAHCFACQRNWNNIDLLLALDFDFRSAVALLERLLHEHLSRRSKRSTTETR